MILWELLTPRQRDVANLLVKGYREYAIAKELNIAPRTVREHLYNMYTFFDLPATCDKAVSLAVALILNRHPDLWPGFGASSHASSKRNVECRQPSTDHWLQLISLRGPLHSGRSWQYAVKLLAANGINVHGQPNDWRQLHLRRGRRKRRVHADHAADNRVRNVNHER